MSNKSYLTKDTIKEERAKMVRESIVISMLDSQAPAKEAMEFHICVGVLQC